MAWITTGCYGMVITGQGRGAPAPDRSSVAGWAARPPSPAPQIPFSLNSGWFLTLNYLMGFPGVSSLVSMEFFSLQWDKKCVWSLPHMLANTGGKQQKPPWENISAVLQRHKNQWYKKKAVLKHLNIHLFPHYDEYFIQKPLLQVDAAACIQQARGIKPALRQHFRQHLIKSQRFECCLPHHIVFPGVDLNIWI